MEGWCRPASTVGELVYVQMTIWHKAETFFPIELSIWLKLAFK